MQDANPRPTGLEIAGPTAAITPVMSVGGSSHLQHGASEPRTAMSAGFRHAGPFQDTHACRIPRLYPGRRDTNTQHCQSPEIKPTMKLRGNASGLLAGVQQAFGIKHLLDVAMELDGLWIPLEPKSSSFDPADAVFSRDGPAEVDRQHEQLITRGGSTGLAVHVVAIDQETSVQVAVAGVSPATGIESVSGADFKGTFRPPQKVGRVVPPRPLRVCRPGRRLRL